MMFDRIITDHRLREQDAFVMPPLWRPDFTDRSFVKDGCHCSYCTWTPTEESS